MPVSQALLAVPTANATGNATDPTDPNVDAPVVAPLVAVPPTALAPIILGAAMDASVVSLAAPAPLPPPNNPPMLGKPRTTSDPSMLPPTVPAT